MLGTWCAPDAAPTMLVPYVEQHVTSSCQDECQCLMLPLATGASVHTRSEHAQGHTRGAVVACSTARVHVPTCCAAWYGS